MCDEPSAESDFWWTVFYKKNCWVVIVSYESVYRNSKVRKLQHEISLFFDTLSKYQKLPSEGLRNRLRLLLSRKSAFASFKRDYIRDNLEKYENLLVFLQ